MNQRLTAVIVFAIAAAYTHAAMAITVETVPVGEVGNPNDPNNHRGIGEFGAVNYAYNIGKYEITVGQYTEFLNAVAAVDTYSLYNPAMPKDGNVAGIARTCDLTCSYSVVGSPNYPVTYVSIGDALRFANWMHNGQPSGAQDITTTEDGAYFLNGADIVEFAGIVRKPGARWFLPTEDEWYKAAYYQPADKGGDSDGYWLYPMKTNDVPYSDQPPGATPDNTRVANFRRYDDIDNGYNDGYAVTGSRDYSGDQIYLTEVGAYPASLSYFGTLDQCGNVQEMTETIRDFSGSIIYRGGSFGGQAGDVQAGDQNILSLGFEGSGVGFRIGSIFVPEPSTLLLAAAGLPLLSRRRR